MRAYYLSKIKSAEDPVVGGITYFHRIQEYPMLLDYIGGDMKSDPATGVPTEKAVLVLVGAKHHAALRGDPELIPLPVGRDSLAVKLSAIETPTKLQFRNKLRQFGFDQAEIAAMTDDVRSWRDVCNDLGRKNNAAFDVDAFDFDEA